MDKDVPHWKEPASSPRGGTCALRGGAGAWAAAEQHPDHPWASGFKSGLAEAHVIVSI